MASKYARKYSLICRGSSVVRGALTASMGKTHGTRTGLYLAYCTPTLPLVVKRPWRSAKIVMRTRIRRFRTVPSGFLSASLAQSTSSRSSVSKTACLRNVDSHAVHRVKHSAGGNHDHASRCQRHFSTSRPGCKALMEVREWQA